MLRRYSKIGIVFFVVLALGVHFISAHACTGLRVMGLDKSVIFARTMEFATPLESNILFVPRNQSWKSQTPDGKDGMAWKNTYAFIGPDALGDEILVEGMNEKGLYIGAFWFPNIAEYQKTTPEDNSKTVAPTLFAALVLGKCATVQEVKDNIQQVKIAAVAFEKLGGVPPLHWYVMDSTGKAIVIEPVNGEIVVMDNPVGVFTNSPPFGWHLQNLANYVNLRPTNATAEKLGELKVSQIGQGSGMLGVPGDFTPPSRFVRAALLSNTAKPVKTADEAVNLALTLISNITISKGTVIEDVKGGQNALNYTQWVTVYDLTQKRLYFRTYGNQNIRMITPEKLPLDGKKKLIIPMCNVKPEYQNVTDQAK